MTSCALYVMKKNLYWKIPCTKNFYKTELNKTELNKKDLNEKELNEKESG